MPRIFSLSTVGVRCHYHQDYLFHESRTDFVGDNGVGKSIIADLFQLMFVTERPSIEFGTEGVDEERRQLHTIPYKSAVAYAFLNIEMKSQQFISIGVQISSKESVPLKLFLVTANLDLESSIDDCTYEFHKLLEFEDFIYEDQSVLEPDALAKKLRDSKNLIVHFFKDKGQKNQYYQWLYINHVFPINLSEGSNLKAFAKVVQSFSRAKTLNVKKPEQLKSFLFDDSEKDIFKEFDNSKDQLTSLLNDYRLLSEEIKDLEAKQEVLINLKDLEKIQINCFKEYLGNDLNIKHLAFNRTSEDLKSSERQLEGLIRSLEENNQLVAKVEVELSGVEKSHREALDNFKNLLTYKSKQENLKNARAELTRLSDMLENLKSKTKNRSAVVLSSQENLETAKNELSNIQNRIPDLRSKAYELKLLGSSLEKVTPLLSRYSSHKKMVEDFENQESKILNILQEENQLLKEYESFARLLDDQIGKDTILQWAIKQNLELTREQESVLLEYKDTLIIKPEDHEFGDSFTLDPQEFLSQKNLKRDTKTHGVWVRQGVLNTLLQLKDQSLFSSRGKVRELVNKRREELSELIVEVKSRIKKINKLRIGEYDDELLEEYGLDENLLKTHLVDIAKKHFEDFKKKSQILNKVVKTSELYEETLEESGKKKRLIDTLHSEIQKALGEIQDIDLKINKAENDLKLKSAEAAKLESDIISVRSLLPDKLILEAIDDEIDKWEKESAQLLKEKSTLDSKKVELTQKISNISPQVDAFRQTRIPELKELLEDRKINLEDARFNWEQSFQEKVEKVLDGLVVELEQDVAQLKAEFEDSRRNYINSYSKICYSGEFKETNRGENSRLKIQIDNEAFTFSELEQVLLGKIRTSDNIVPDLKRANSERDKIKEVIITRMVKVFSKTQIEFERHRDIVRDLNHFFLEKKISNKYEFKIDFENKGKYDINWIDRMLENRHSYQTDLFGQSNSDGVLAEDFLVDFYNKEIKGTKAKSISDLLNPKNYFTLNISLKDSNGNSLPGSGGESYASLVLLCIGRLSKVQRQPHEGIRFIILEETASLDDTNFGIFPEIAKSFDYQLITMTPKPFAVGADSGWFLHHLIKGKGDDYINHHPPASYFRTTSDNRVLDEYLSSKAN